MSKYLALCNQLVSLQSTCKEPLPSGGIRRDHYIEVSGILTRAKLSHDELMYGRAVVGDGFNFEVRLQQRARIILALSFNLSEDKLALYSARLAELTIMYCRGQVKGKPMEWLAQQAGFKSWSWHKRYKAIYNELCDWCDSLESEANAKVWNTIEGER